MKTRVRWGAGMAPAPRPWSSPYFVRHPLTLADTISCEKRGSGYLPINFRCHIVSIETIISCHGTNVTSTLHITQLEDHLGYWLRRVSNAVSGAFARALQEKQTSVAEWVLLREVHERGQTAPGELAESLGLTRGAVSKIVDKLDAKARFRRRQKRATAGSVCFPSHGRDRD
jgi:hypothetical protein